MKLINVLTGRLHTKLFQCILRFKGLKKFRSCFCRGQLPLYDLNFNFVYFFVKTLCISRVGSSVI